jgi:hypothetical protein
MAGSPRNNGNNDDDDDMVIELRIKLAGYVARTRETRIAYKILVRKPEGKITHGRPRRRWKYNIRIDLKRNRAGMRTGCIWLRIGTSGGLL